MDAHSCSHVLRCHRISGDNSPELAAVGVSLETGSGRGMFYFGTITNKKAMMT